MSPSFLKDSFAGWSALDWQCFSFSTLSISSHDLLACEVSAEKSADKIMGFPCKLQAFFLMLLLRFFSLSFIFDSFITMYLGENLFKLILLGDLWASWTWMSKSLSRFGKFSAIISLSSFLPPSLSLFSFWNSNDLHTCSFDGVP